jgi:hypothetical protein
MASKKSIIKFWLGSSEPGSTIKILTELDMAADRGLNLVLNSGGQAKFSHPLNHRKVQKIKEITTCLVVTQNNSIIWSGPIMDTEEDFGNNKLSCTAVGWLEELEYCFVQPGQVSGLAFSDADSAQMAFTLLDYANSRVDLRSESIYDIWPTKISKGHADVATKRSRVYAVD